MTEATRKFVKLRIVLLLIVGLLAYGCSGQRSGVIKLGEGDLEKALQSEQPVLLVFHADWQWNPGPFEKSPPVILAIKDIASEYEGKIKVYKVEVNTNEDPIAKKFGIKWIPTILFYKNGVEVLRKEGGGCTLEKDKEVLKGIVEEKLQES